MLLSTFVANVKRRTQSGEITNTGDQPTTDIINFLNNRMFQVWRMWPWNWLWVPISFNTIIGTTDYSIIGSSDAPGVLSSVGDIIALTGLTGGYLIPITYKRYLQWHVSQQLDPSTQQTLTLGDVTHYVKVGRDTAGNLKIRLWRTPGSVFAITGFGKQRITQVTLANLATAGFTIPYFPPEVQDILEYGVESDVYDTLNQQQNSSASDAEFLRGIEELKADESSGQDEDMTTPPPDLYIFNKRKRGGTTVV